ADLCWHEGISYVVAGHSFRAPPFQLALMVGPEFPKNVGPAFRAYLLVHGYCLPALQSDHAVDSSALRPPVFTHTHHASEVRKCVPVNLLPPRRIGLLFAPSQGLREVM